MKNFFGLLGICFLLSVPVLGHAQIAAELEEMLGTAAVSYDAAASFILRAANVSDPGSPEEAFRFAAERQWLPKSAVSGDTAGLGGVSLLLMKSFGMKGGIFYSLVGNPHYAYRELVYEGIIQGKTDPEMSVSGDMLLFMVSRILSRYEEDPGFETAEVEEAPPPPVYQPVVIEATPEQLALVKEINTQLEAAAVTDTSARVTSEGVTISLSNILFLANSAELPESEMRKLDDVAEILKNIPARSILVSGHTALAGTPEDRLKTSQDRAGAVAAYLIFLNVRQPGEVFSQGHGAERPIADNSTPQGMALNRRVEITILENR